MMYQRNQSLLVLGLLAGASAFSTPRAAHTRSSVQQTWSQTSSKLSMSKATDDEATSDENTAEHESYSLDLSRTIYTSSMKSPKDAYIAFAEKGAANCKLPKRKIFHQSVLGGCYVGFGGLLSLCVAGNIPGIAGRNPGLQKMAFAALFPVNLLLIATTGGQLFTGNSATAAAARYEGLVDNREVLRNWAISLLGNVVGCSLMAAAAWYSGCLVGGAADLTMKTAVGKVGATFGKNFVKAILCNWMVSIAVFLSGASNDLVGKLVGVWFPISTFVAIGLEHSVANLFIMPAAMLLKANLTWGNIMFRNVIPVLLGNAVAGAFVVAASYSYQFGRLGGNTPAEKLEKYEQKTVASKIEVTSRLPAH
eukprot:CAMPEP_0198136574 /NCGR_PEP_ID=MMETSP1443-20131203/218_1 /TAXON_ID=186043 /ORGANISM="Entomoneis sp., Strain CCMP2396" /LENGTH=364 /DNA_ID=CAMNT_0043797821 /DNA_START=33 /DNA_END=1127 /DNA_ORIENTATION=-